jgi:N-acetylneuraminate synthase
MLLHCVSGYPTPVEQSNLRTIQALAERFDAPIGLSDHTMGIASAVAGVALGAVAIEKHVCLSRAEGGVDSAFSLEPDELKALVEGTRDAWRALGRPTFARQASEEPNVKFRRSLYIVADVAEGETLTCKHVRSIRPGYGAAPRELARVLGRRALKPLARGTALTPEIIERDTRVDERH